MTNAVFYVSYRLKRGVSISDFLNASEKLHKEHLSKQKGYVSWKQLVSGKTWVDIATFETMEDLNNFVAASRKPNEVAKNFYSYINLFSCKARKFSVEKNYD